MNKIGIKVTCIIKLLTTILPKIARKKTTKDQLNCLKMNRKGEEQRVCYERLQLSDERCHLLIHCVKAKRERSLFFGAWRGWWANKSFHHQEICWGGCFKNRQPGEELKTMSTEKGNPWCWEWTLFSWWDENNVLRDDCYWDVVPPAWLSRDPDKSRIQERKEYQRRQVLTEKNKRIQETNHENRHNKRSRYICCCLLNNTLDVLCFAWLHDDCHLRLCLTFLLPFVMICFVMKQMPGYEPVSLFLIEYFFILCPFAPIHYIDLIQFLSFMKTEEYYTKR